MVPVNKIHKDTRNTEYKKYTRNTEINNYCYGKNTMAALICNLSNIVSK